MESWHAGGNASTEVWLGRVFEWGQCWRVEVRGTAKETGQKDGDGDCPGQQGREQDWSETVRAPSYVPGSHTAQDSKSEQNDVDMIGADSGAIGQLRLRLVLLLVQE